MICIHICASPEWAAVREILRADAKDIRKYPLGEYFEKQMAGSPCLFYQGGSTKTRSAAACQYAIDHLEPSLSSSMIASAWIFSTKSPIVSNRRR
jgi:hypothetical protein